MNKLLVLASSLVVAGSAIAQMPMPAFSTTFTSTLTRGFWFQAPVGFTIQGLEVYNESNQPFQVVEVIDFGTTPPPTWPATAPGTQLFYDNSSASGTIIATNIQCSPGNYYGILAACNPSQGSATSHNSYGASPFTSSILGQPTVITRLGTQSGIASNGGNQPCFSENAGSVGRCDVYVGTGSGNFAQKLLFGEGCYDEFASFYEIWGGGAIDIPAGSSLDGTNTGAGYLVLPGSNAIDPPTNNITIADDQVLQQSLGWTFPYPGGTTTDIWVSSNGFVTFTANTSSGCCSGNANTLLTGGQPRLAALWNDLNPAAGGTVSFDTDTNTGEAWVTFDQVPRFGTQDLNTFQYYFNQAGQWQLRYGQCDAQTGTTLIGFSPGNNNTDPGQIDITATPVILTAANDLLALSLNSDTRPVIGTMSNILVDNIPAGSPFSAVIFGLSKLDPGLPLTSVGMDGCQQYCSQDSVLLIVSPGTSTSTPFNIPNDPGLAQVIFVLQAAAYNPAAINQNVLGAISSNGMEWTFNVN